MTGEKRSGAHQPVGYSSQVALFRREPIPRGEGLHHMPGIPHARLRDDWRALKRGRPGHRFQDHYERARDAGPNRGLMKRAATFGLAAIAIAIGLFLAVFPGPAIPFFIIAGTLLATQSRTVARAMDWLELRVRDAFAWLKRRWRRLSRGGRVAAMLVGIGCSATLGVLTFCLLRG